METTKKQELIEWIKDILVAVIIALIILYFFKPVVIRKSSMEDSFHENDFIVISKQSYNIFTDVKRGDVVIFKEEYDNSEKLLIKRVIALPGETIEINEEGLFINDELLTETYLKETGKNGYYEKTTINEGEYFVMGDNREVSLDSRSFGTIREETIIGRVVFRLFPIKSKKIIKRIEY